MSPRIDWGGWLSMAAIAAVCLFVATRSMPEVEPFEVIDPPQPAKAAVKPSAPTGYAINTPDQTFQLETALSEISGLSMAADGKSLWAIHDERPILFRIAIADGSVLQQIDLGKKRDFESVEEVSGRVYLASSDGTMLVVDPSGEKPIEKISLASRLGVGCNLEGMAYDPKGERLLLACKDESVQSAKSDKRWHVYGFGIGSQKVKKEPAYVISQRAIEAFGFRAKTFGPSGIAVHPKTGDIFVISTRGKLMVVLSPDGEVKSVEAMDAQVHRQPEGITFAADGTMFISNEAHGQTATLHVIKERAAK